MAVWLLMGVATASLGQDVDAATASERVERARDVLEMAAAAYRRVPALVDTATYEIRRPTADPAHGEMRLILGAGTDVRVDRSPFIYTALGDGLYVTRADSPERYVRAPFDGDFGRALRRLFVKDDFWPPEPIQIALRAGEGIDAYLAALRFKPLDRLRLTNHAVVEDDAKGPLHRLTLVADNGQVEVFIDAATHFVRRARVVVADGEAADHLTANVNYEPRVVEQRDRLIAVNVDDRVAVEAISLLDPRRPAPGRVAPTFDRMTLAGERINLEQLRGTVVVLDFWATWCIPCRRALPELQQFASWAEASGKPIRVITVNTRETFVTAEERSAAVRDFWEERGFTMSILIDEDNSVSDAFGSPGLPFTVVVEPAGKIEKIHVGYQADLVEKLKRETTGLLEESSP